MDRRDFFKHNLMLGIGVLADSQKDSKDLLMSSRMNPNQAYERLCVLEKEVARLRSINRLLHWDQTLMLPKAGLPYRKEQLETLNMIIHQKATSPEIDGLLEVVESSDLVADETSDIGANVRELRREYDRDARLPGELVAEMSQAEAEGHALRLEALEKNDFRVFSPALKKIIDLAKQKAEAWGYANEPYDALLESYEPGLTAEEVSHLLGALSGEITKLLEEIRATGKKPEIPLDKGPYPMDAQRHLCTELVNRLGLNRDFVRMDGADMAFCEAIVPGDIRLAALFNEKDFRQGFLGCFHEAGHALYHAGLNTKDFGLPTGTCSSYAIRESQARLWENNVGHSSPFWDFWYPQFRKVFPEALKRVESQDFLSWVNQVVPSFIRVDADEVTYNLHIVLRFEIERALFKGDLDVDDIPEAWNAQFEELLGLTPSNLLEGCLQDVHWSWGELGYFPTYALGNVYAAQFYHSAKSEIKDLELQLSAGNYTPLREWLREKIHRHGQRFVPKELVERVTGKPPSHEFLVHQLWDRYGKIYGVRRSQG